jgi:hypothetical protein
MLDILTKQQGGVTSVASVGTFFEEYFRLKENMEKFTNPDALEQSLAGLDLSGDMITMTDEMKGIMFAHINWIEFLQKHVGNGVSSQNPACWPPERVTKFLRDHDINPRPLPPYDIQCKLAKCLCYFIMESCMFIDSMPNDDQAEAMGADFMGTATEEDLATIAKMNSEPDIKLSTYLNVCPSGCGNIARKVCSRCKTTAYCSPECQKSHWKSHKRECKPPK